MRLFSPPFLLRAFAFPDLKSQRTALIPKKHSLFLTGRKQQNTHSLFLSLSLSFTLAIVLYLMRNLCLCLSLSLSLSLIQTPHTLHTSQSDFMYLSHMLHFNPPSLTLALTQTHKSKAFAVSFHSLTHSRTLLLGSICLSFLLSYYNNKKLANNLSGLRSEVITHRDKPSCSLSHSYSFRVSVVANLSASAENDP